MRLLMGSTFLGEVDRLGVYKRIRRFFCILFLVRQVVISVNKLIFLGGIVYGIQNRHSDCTGMPDGSGE